MDGARLKKIEGLAANTNCATVPVSTPATLYFGPIEIRNYKQANEQVIAYPHPSVKLTNGRALANTQFLHRDHLDLGSRDHGWHGGCG